MFGQLKGEEQRATQVFAVGNLDYRPGRLTQEDVPGHPLVIRARQQVLDAGRVDKGQFVTVHLHPAVRYFDGGARVVGNIHPPAGEGGEEGRFAHIGVAHEDHRTRARIEFDGRSVTVH